MSAGYTVPDLVPCHFRTVTEMEHDTRQSEVQRNDDGEGNPTATGSNNAAVDAGQAVVEHIFTPGSTLNPTFLLIADSAFVALLIVLLAMLAATRSIHFVALTAIELALWITVKWCVSSPESVFDR